jgi:Uncharacterized conserved protein (DUF2358)
MSFMRHGRASWTRGTAPTLRAHTNRRLAMAPRATATTEASGKVDMQALMRTLEEDSPNLFNEGGMDLSIYADDVDFKDPITNYDSVQVRNNHTCAEHTS